MAETSNRQKDVFLKALELPPAERAAFFTQACGTDVTLRRQIEAMLQAHAALDSFLEKPAAAMGATVDAGTAPPLATVLPDAFLGTRIGPYKLREQIGEGGMGVVYVAEQQEPVRRMVALKLIKPGMDSAQVLARFEAERQALALMDHPNIAKVLDAGTTAEGRPYFVMELVKGVPITQYCDERRLSLRQRLELFIPVCQAVQHAHQKAIIHRDLKPSNLLIALYDGKPVPKVIDFGVAKAMGEQLTDKSIYTGFGAVVGTLAYMSPEQAELNQIDIDTRSDIYSLGVMLYELLTGSTPIERQRLKEGAILEVLRLIREEEPPRPSTRISTANTLVTLSEQRQTEPAQLAILLRGDIDWIVMKSLDKDRARRYETAVELGQDIERFLKDEPVEASPPSAAYRLRKFVRRNRGAVTAATLVLATLLIGIAGTTVGLLEARKGRDGAERARLDEQKERERAENAEKKIGEQLTEVLETKGQLTIALGRAEKSSRDEKDARQLVERERKQTEKELDRAESLLYVSQFKEAFHHFEKADFVNCRLALDECRWDMRGPEYGYLVKQMDQRGRRLFGPRSNGHMLLSRDGKRLFTGNALTYSVSEWDAKTGAFVRNLHAPAYFCRSLAESGDGKRLFAGFGSTIVAWDLTTGEMAFKLGLGNETYGYTSLAVSRDGKRLYAGSSRSDKALTVCDLDERKQITTFPTMGMPECLVLSPDDKLLFSTDSAKVRAWDLTTGKEAFPIENPEQGNANAYSLAFADDGKTLVSSKEAEIVHWNAATGKEIRRWKVDRIHAGPFALSKDGKQLASGCYDGSIMVWDVAKGNLLQSMRGHADLVTGLAFSPDGRHLHSISREGAVWIWDLKAKHESHAYLSHKTAIHALAQDANGNRLVSTDGTGTILVWHRDTQKIVSTLKEKEFVNYLALSRDGKHLYTALHDAKTIQAWDVDGGKKTFTLEGHGGLIRGLAVSPDGKTLYSASDDKTIKAWDLETRKEIYIFRGHSDPIQALVLSQDGARLVSSSQAGLIISADARTGKEFRSYSVTAAVGNLALTSDGKRLVYGSHHTTIHVLDLDAGREVQAFRGQIPSGGIALSKNDRRVFTASGHDGTFRIWDMISGREILSRKEGLFVTALLPTIDGRQLLCGRGNGAVEVWDLAASYEPSTFATGVYVRANRLAVSDDGKRLVTAGSDHVIRTWDHVSGKELLALPAHRNLINAIAVSGDGRWLATADHDKLVKRWDLATGKEVQVLIGHDKPVGAVLLSSDGKRLFSADTTIKEWDLQTGKPLRTLPGHPLGGVAFLGLSRDCTRLVSAAGDNTLKIWDLSTGKETLAFRCLYTPALNKDGNRLACLDPDQSIKIWNLDTGQVVTTLSGQGHRLAMSGDGKRLYAGDMDGVITVYDLDTAKTIRTLHGHTLEILHLALRADGKRLYSIGYDAMKVWDVE